MTELPVAGLPRSSIHDEIEAAVRELDLAERAAALDRSPAFPRAEFRELGRRRLLGLVTAGELGGRGLSVVQAGLALHALAYGTGATTWAKLSLQPEFCSVLAAPGADPSIGSTFRSVVRGERLVGNQLTEASAGSDLRGIVTRADPVPGGYRLEGTKTEAAFAADAEAAIVYAQVPPHADGPGGLTAFLVPQDDAGIDRQVVPDLGERWMRRGTVRYAGVHVPTAQRLGAEGQALAGVLPELNRERGLLAMIYLGVARRSFEETVAHVGTREAFGSPLSAQEAVAFPLADDWAQLDAVGLYALEVLRRRDSGQGGAGEPAMAKTLSVELALRVLDHAIQFHGGRGYSAALPFERRWRDVRSGGLAHGSSEMMRATAARSLWPSKRRRPA